MDKEKLIKHHFWILLGLAVVLIPVALGGVWMGVAEATTKQVQNVEAKKSALSSQKPRGENFVAQLEDQRTKLDGSKSEVWKVNAEPQNNLIQWPRALASLNQAYFGDKLEPDQVTIFKRNDVYLSEFEDLAQLVKPTELAGGWDKVMRHVRFGAKFPTTEDCWLALEDLCIQREMLNCVKAVNDLLATFWDETAKSEKELKDYFKPVDGESVHRFVSPYWVLDLAVSRPVKGKDNEANVRGNEFNVRGRLMNKSHRRLNVGRIDFLVSMNEGRPSTLSVDGQYIAVYREDEPKWIEFKERRIQGNVAKPTIVAVQQKLDYRFVPVKRIDKIALGYHSHRTADKPLVIGAVSEEEKKKAPAAATEGGDPNAAAGAAVAERTNSGIDRLRYLTVTKQVRRMPIGIVMIVDQAHVQDVLRAFANSRLHFQTTQLHLSRYRGQAAAPTSTQPSGADESNTNLVEVSLYGLASIYEKFRDMAAGAPAPANGSANPATPDAAPAANSNPAATPPAQSPTTPAPATPAPAPTPQQPKVG